MDRDKGIAYCGLACCVCSENATCAGCRNEGCKDKDWCKPFACCKRKPLPGCWACASFPCDTPMLQKLRVRTFARFVAERGEAALMDALETLEGRGLRYHYPGQLVGDYDLARTEDELTHLLLSALEGAPDAWPPAAN